MLFGSETLYLYRLLVVYHVSCTCYLYGRLVWCLTNLHFFRFSCPCNSDLVLILLALFDALSLHSDICIVASHLDTLDGQHVDMKHVMTEPNPRWRWWTRPEEKRTCWSNWRPGSKSEGPKALLVLTLTQCYPRQVFNGYLCICALSFLGVEWNHRCMIPRFSQLLYLWAGR